MDSGLEEGFWSSLSTSYAIGLVTVLFIPMVLWLYGSSLRQWLTSFVLCGVSDVPSVTHKKGSDFCERVVKKCPILQEPYTPPLWGRSGHIQSFVFGASLCAFNAQPLRGQRHSVVVRDGSTLHYDVYQPQGTEECLYTILVCPGISNTSESDYIKGFTAHALKAGFRVVVFNHLGALKGERLTGRRIFTYGGTGDISAVFDHASTLLPHTQFVGVGFSLGACVLLRFLGEDEERRKRFVCAASVCQGYDPTIALKRMHDWSNFRWLYNYGIARNQVSRLRRHSDALLTSANSTHPHPQSDLPTTQGTSQSSSHVRSNLEDNSTDSPVYPRVHRCHGDYDHNGIALERERVKPPNIEKLRRARSMAELDEYFTRRVCGFDSCEELYRWTSCVDLMWEIRELPMLIVNSRDDPLVAHLMLDIPRKYIEHNPNALFVVPRHGGHLGFFEGGLIIPNSVTWLDRLLVQFSHACISELTD